MYIICLNTGCGEVVREHSVWQVLVVKHHVSSIALLLTFFFYLKYSKVEYARVLC